MRRSGRGCAGNVTAAFSGSLEIFSVGSSAATLPDAVSSVFSYNDSTSLEF